MAKKSGQARVLTPDEITHTLDVIKDHRHPEKNRAIMLISFRLGLRVQEIALLEIKEVAKLNAAGTDFHILEMMKLPAAYTKGANSNNKETYKRRNVSFTVDEFDRIVRQIERLAKAGADINPQDFHPAVKTHKGQSRDLPLVDQQLIEALQEHLALRLAKQGRLQPSDPLFVTQKGGRYSPGTLQEHMALILSGWAGLERASSHSGRRTLITDILHSQNMPLKIAQKAAGHKNGSTTLIYAQPTDEQIAEAFKGLASISS